MRPRLPFKRRSRHTKALHSTRTAPRRRAASLGRLRRRGGSRELAGRSPRRPRGAGRQSRAAPDREAERRAANVTELQATGPRRAAGELPETKASRQRFGNRRRTFSERRDAGTLRSSPRGRRGLRRCRRLRGAAKEHSLAPAVIPTRERRAQIRQGNNLQQTLRGREEGGRDRTGAPVLAGSR